MPSIRTDLAVEAHAYWMENAEETSALEGVISRESSRGGFPLTTVTIVDKNGEKALGKPRGTYLTLDISAFWNRKINIFRTTVETIAQLLKPMLPENGPVLVAGLGNRAMTPDALGPGCLEHLLVTRHLGDILPEFRAIAALSGGVSGSTGLEAAEWVKGVTEQIHPAAVIVVDALAARALDRVCSSVQIADTGLTPGSGVGNHRMALNQENLGVPVLSVGIPTIVDIDTIVRDITANHTEPTPKGFFVTPDSIDAKIKELSKVLGYGISLALHPELDTEDLEALLS